MPWRSPVVRVVVMILWVIALIALAVVNGWLYAVGGTLLTIGVGALLDSPWILPIPLLLAAALIVPLALSDDEGFSLHDDTYGAVIPAVLLAFVLPATAALGGGIAGRRVLSRDRER